MVLLSAVTCVYLVCSIQPRTRYEAVCTAPQPAYNLYWEHLQGESERAVARRAALRIALAVRCV
jgi:hypothetical protein